MDILSKLIFGVSIESVGPSEAQKKIAQKPKPFLLDVRQPDEYRSGHIPGSRLIPLGELSSRMKELPKNQEILCVCQSGSRSISAARQLAKAGYTVVNLRGGMSAWSRAGLSMSKGK